MVGLVLSTEQVRAAPPEVREWIKGLIDAELAGAFAPQREAPATLASLSVPEAAAIAGRIQGDFLTLQLFFELGREAPPGAPQPPHLHRAAIADIVRHVRLPSPDRFGAAIEAIQEAFRQVRGDPQAALFGFDQRGGIYVHENTQRAIHAVWERFVGAQPVSAEAAPPPPMPMPPMPMPPMSMPPLAQEGGLAPFPGEADH